MRKAAATSEARAAVVAEPKAVARKAVATTEARAAEEAEPKAVVRKALFTTEAKAAEEVGGKGGSPISAGPKVGAAELPDDAKRRKVEANEGNVSANECRK